MSPTPRPSPPGMPQDHQESQQISDSASRQSLESTSSDHDLDDLDCLAPSLQAVSNMLCQWLSCVFSGVETQQGAHDNLEARHTQGASELGEAEEWPVIHINEDEDDEDYWLQDSDDEPGWIPMNNMATPEGSSEYWNWKLGRLCMKNNEPNDAKEELSGVIEERFQSTPLQTVVSPHPVVTRLQNNEQEDWGLPALFRGQPSPPALSGEVPLTPALPSITVARPRTFSSARTSSRYREWFIAWRMRNRPI
ncbi:hypothetical protein QBC36DRAFT_285978 [Triangularia setosa]|uniref:Uncharacterized protein n=1 Tax=Triangularia setosa TaxID=2587417 RepID=A0AAN6WFK4_9PEZI|nr:hypothetical protein QBC36DRAFT_285978 [Podospora setosa]